VAFAPIDGKGIVKVAYLVDPDGTVAVSESLEDAGGLSEAQYLFRFGMRFAMPGQYSDLDFFGLGPWENYADRNSAALLGRFRQRVEEQYHYGYARAQEFTASLIGEAKDLVSGAKELKKTVAREDKDEEKLRPKEE
jgi:beta-galactosidase